MDKLQVWGTEGNKRLSIVLTGHDEARWQELFNLSKWFKVYPHYIFESLRQKTLPLNTVLAVLFPENWIL